MKYYYLGLFFLLIPLTTLIQSAEETQLDYRAIRKEARGRQHDQIKTPRGTIFYKVKIVRIGDHSIEITHQDGISLLEFGSVPEEWVKEFGMTDKNQRRTKTTQPKQAAAPKVDLSSQVKVEGDTTSGLGLVVTESDKYYVYLPCSVVSANEKIIIKAQNNTSIQYARVIECAEGLPLARIQIKLPDGSDAKPIQTADADAVAQVKKHQFLYYHSDSKDLKPLRFSSQDGKYLLAGNISSLAKHGTAILLNSTQALGIVVGKLPESLRSSHTRPSRFDDRGTTVALIGTPLKWKKVKLKDFLSARNRIQAYDSETDLIEAFSSCSASDGKISFDGSNAQSVFKKHQKNSSVTALLKLNDTLNKRSMRANEAEVTRKLNGILGSVARKSKRELNALPPKAFSWYHRHFFQNSYERRKSAVDSLVRKMEQD